MLYVRPKFNEDSEATGHTISMLVNFRQIHRLGGGGGKGGKTGIRRMYLMVVVRDQLENLYTLVPHCLRHAAPILDAEVEREKLYIRCFER